MAKVLADTTMSLDGFIAGPNDEMDWVFDYAGDVPAPLVGEVIETTACLRPLRPAADLVSTPAGEDRPVTHAPPDDEPDPAYTFISGDIREATARALAAGRGGNLLVLGANVVGQCLREGLLDELLIILLPVLLGDGVRLFGESGAAARLETLDASASGQVVNLRYRVLK